MDSINWFFFDFLILGYVEDPLTGNSFRFPGGLEWSIYVEVPSYGLNMPPENSLTLFRRAIPTLALIGSTHQVCVCVCVCVLSMCYMTIFSPQLVSYKGYLTYFCKILMIVSIVYWHVE